MKEEKEDRERIAGFINSIIFANDSTGYKVLDVESEDGLELFTAVGILPDVEVGEKIEASGRWEQHSTYGDQFSIREYWRTVPDDAESMERYLGSGVIKGIGEALARRIVDTFGSDTFRIIGEEPERLASVKGIGNQKAIEISQQFVEKAASREAMIFLQGLGLTPLMSMRVYEAFGARTVATVKSNPYLLAEKVEGISFQKADEIAAKSGLSPEAPARIRAAIRFVLLQAAQNGHTYLPRSAMEELLFQITGVGGAVADAAYEQALMNKSIVARREEEEECVYLHTFFHAEAGTARRIAELCAFCREKPEQEQALLGRIEKIEKELQLTLSDQQRQAVAWGYSRGIVIITGGPGTGKTTIIRVLLALLEEDGCSYALAAPTGKAAKRMEEATDVEARTIHRLLEVQASLENEGGHMIFNRNEENPLEQEYLIIDEMSMVDISLMYHLVKAVPDGAHMVLLGDRDQLPSVGCGNVLRDMIESGEVPVCRLTHIYRQSGESSIVRNAHRINEGSYPVFDNSHTDFFLMREKTAQEAADTLVDTVKRRFKKFYHCDPVEDILVLSPMKKGTLGVRELNGRLQEALNPPSRDKKELRSGETLFREGDKVMQTRNNYEMAWEIRNKYGVAIEEGKGVFNGDTGRVEKIDGSGVSVCYDGIRHVVYEVGTLQQLELAYAITIHKSQGTESPVIVLPLVDGPAVLLSRNLLYTAVTRARKYVVIIGKEETVRRMVDNDQHTVRYSALAKQIREEAARLKGPEAEELGILAKLKIGTGVPAGSGTRGEAKKESAFPRTAETKTTKKKVTGLDLISSLMGYEESVETLWQEDLSGEEWTPEVDAEPDWPV